MTEIYRFSPTSLVDEVVVVTSENGSRRAYLHAGEKSDAAQLEDIKEKLQLNGWQAIPGAYDGKPMLEVRAFGKDEKLLDSLEQYNCTHGKPAHTSLKKESVGLWSKIKNRSLQTSGLFYLGGDAAYTTYGYKESHWEDMLAGLFYFGGSGTLMAYGQNDQADLQISDMSKGMLKHAMNTSAKLPESCSLAAITKDRQKGIIGNAEELFRRYPSEIMNTFFGLAGVCIASSALRHRVLHPLPAGTPANEAFWHKFEGLLDVGLGGMTAASGAVSAIVKEKKHDPDEPAPETLAGRIKAWVQEKPLRVAGYGYIASTLCHAGSTTIAMLQAKRNNDTKRLSSVPFRAAFVGANLIAEFLMSISSKGHGEGVTSDESVKESMYSIAAELILKQPKEIQESQFRHMVNFLEHPSVMAEKRNVVEQKLREHMSELMQNPWTCVGKKEEVLIPAATVPKTLASRAPESADWKEKLAFQKAAQPAAGTPAML